MRGAPVFERKTVSARPKEIPGWQATYSETIEMKATLGRAARLSGSCGTRRRQDIVRCAAMLIKCDDE